MKKLLCILSLLMFSALALGQVNLPPCDPNNVPPNCTDYFGVANWANSPLPQGPIASFTIKAAGSGYVNPVFVITDPTGSGATAPAFTLDLTGGLATVTGGGGGLNYIAPQITVVDVGAGGTLAAPTCGAAPLPACGSGAIVLPTIGGTLTPGTGIRKFMDPLPDLKAALAVPDTTTFPGSDYYVIGLQEFSPTFHTDLPATKLRAYVQLNSGTDPATGLNTKAPPAQSYLGPVILATKNRPVRVLFKNMLPIGTGGNLFIPVDRTYMGAGMDMNAPGMASYTDNRATLHLHGGATPWISDGTPHQWTAPANEAGPARGDSVQFVPDMWFDTTTGALIPSCAGQGSCSAANATNDPGAGNLTFFWTNQQGGRLMFYHDHAYGITRLNVYVGEAAGYLLADPTEEAALLAASAPGTLATNSVQTAPDLTHLIPLVIQDKTFVPTAAQLAVEDPTWVAGGFGTTPGTAKPGDLWFPHVYTTNQNPADPGGANAFGRWDYGPWTLPGNQTALLAANPQQAVTIPCTSSAFPNQAVNCPITPNPSGTPESFMDTPLVNGKAYPVLHVAPAAYRFQILSAGNDRSLNLQWYLADPTVTTADGRKSTEVKMVPSVQPSGAPGTLPLCTQITPITNTTLFMGLATALLDATGAPLNGTGLPAGCWPNFGAGSQTAGIPVQQTMWAADGRAGGVPDPTTAGPAWIEIGTEGGLLPAPVAIPSMPIAYEANTRSVTITNVSVHGLWLGPAERADAIVDFSKFAGQTLILYNDAPTPAPAVDSRLDYFTDDGDQTPIGGAPNTLAGFGPNTRTIMQVIVDQLAPNTVPFSLPALQAALPGIFAQTQPVPIVPEPTYPPASGGYSPTETYSLISDATLSWFPVNSTTPVTYVDDRKTIQELFTLDYGRMNATLGVELPLTNFLTQTTIPLGYIDPITEVINKGATQLWHITHNGVDTHFIHFHLFNVQVINRSAWDGTKRPPDQNELGWKDTVRMNPLEDILVALQPIQPLPPFPLRDSYRLMDVTAPAGSDCAAPATGLPSPLPCSIFTDVNPANNNPLNTPNEVRNFGWEYVWHCHILGHEENDMMRAIAFQVPPEDPSNLTVTAAVAPASGLNLAWTDNSASETGFTIERDATAAFTNPTSISVGASTPQDLHGQGTTWGGTMTYNDANATGAGPYFYRVQAHKPDATYWGTLPDITSSWSNTASFGGAAVSVSPTALAFGVVALNTTSAPQTVTLSNAGSAPVTYTAAIAGADFVASDPCNGTLPGNASCSISVTFTPTVTPPALETATLTINTPAPFTVALSGTGGTSPLLTITANNTTMNYGGKVPALTFSYNPPNPVGLTAPPTCTTTATSTSPVGTYPVTCSGATGPYTFTYVAGTVSVTPVPLTIWASNGTMTYGGTPPTITPLYVGLVAGDTAATFTVAPTCSTTIPLTGTSPVGTYVSTCSGAVNPNYTISYVAGKVTVNKAALSITAAVSRPYGSANPSIVPTATGLVNGDTIASLGIAISCTTTATTSSPVGTYPITCTGPASTTNYNITYVPGTLTVTPVTLTVTANNASKVYGAPMPTFTATISGFVLGQTTNTVVTGSPILTTTASATSGVGTYTITAALGTLAAPNYTFAFVNGTLTITPAALTVTANNVTKPYGAAVPSPLGASAAGLVNGDTLASIGIGCSTTATAASPVGPYPITCSGNPANYTVSFVAGTLTVTPVPLTITANNSTRAVNTPNPTFTVTGAVFVNGDTLASLSGTLVCTTTATLTSPAGTYPITCGGLTSANYNPITWVPGTLTVTSTVPVLTLAPTALTFTSSANVTSAPQAITVSNTGGANLRITGITLIGANAARFGMTNNCPIGGTGLTPGGSCTVNVTFTPNTNPVTRTAQVRVAVAAPAVTGTVNLTGTTTQATVGLSTTSIAFGNVPINTTSGPQTVTLTNTGTVPLIINGIALGGANPARFAQTNNCPIGGTGLAAGASCTVTVTFHPTRRAARSATLTIRDNGVGSPQTVALTGTGI